MKTLFINTGIKQHGYSFCNAYSSVNNDIYLLDLSSSTSYKWEVKKFENIVDLNNIPDCDIYFGLDHGCLPIIDKIREYKKKGKYSCQVLDIPLYYLQKERYKNSNLAQRWNFYIEAIKRLDRVIYNQIYTYSFLEQVNNKCALIRYPVNPIYLKDCKTKDFILYVGRMGPDKGIINLFSILDYISTDVKLKIITSNEYQHYKKVSEDYNINVEFVNNCSEIDKWKFLHECLFTVSAGTSFNIPPLFITEGLFLDKTSVHFGYEEYKEAHRGFTSSVQDGDIKGFANCILFLLNGGHKTLAKGAGEYMSYNRTYAAWAERLDQEMRRMYE